MPLTLSEIQAAQSWWQPPLVRKRFLVQVNLADISTFNPSLVELWDYDPTQYLGTEPSTTAYMVLFPKVERNDILSAPREFQVSTVGSTYQVSTIRYAFKGTISESPIRLFQILNQTIKEAHSQLDVVVPINVVDFINPDLSGTLPIVQSMGDYGNPRQGIINISKWPGGQIMAYKGGVAIALSLSPWEFSYQDVSLTY